MRIRCSASLLRMVLANVVGNAVKFVRGRPERRVLFHAKFPAERCDLCIEDTGPGIPEASRRRGAWPGRTAGA